jgi:hypothetical protein
MKSINSYYKVTGTGLVKDTDLLTGIDVMFL